MLYFKTISGLIWITYELVKLLVVARCLNELVMKFTEVIKLFPYRNLFSNLVVENFPLWVVLVS